MEVVNHPIADFWGPEWLQPSLMACLGFVVWTTCGNTVPKCLNLRHKWMVARDHAISKWLIFQFFGSNFRFDFLLGVLPCTCPLTICDPKAYCQCIGRSRPNQPIWRGVPVFIRYRQGVCLGVKIYDLLSPKRFKVVQGLKKPIPGSYTICFYPGVIDTHQNPTICPFWKPKWWVRLPCKMETSSTIVWNSHRGIW